MYKVTYVGFKSHPRQLILSDKGNPHWTQEWLTNVRHDHVHVHVQYI